MRQQEKTEYNKSYYKQNKEQSYNKHKEWVEQNKVKKTCEVCNREYPKYDKAHHIQRKYQLVAFNNLNNINNVSLQSEKYEKIEKKPKDKKFKQNSYEEIRKLVEDNDGNDVVQEIKKNKNNTEISYKFKLFD